MSKDDEAEIPTCGSDERVLPVGAGTARVLSVDGQFLRDSVPEFPVAVLLLRGLQHLLLQLRLGVQGQRLRVHTRQLNVLKSNRSRGGYNLITSLLSYKYFLQISFFFPHVVNFILNQNSAKILTSIYFFFGLWNVAKC